MLDYFLKTVGYYWAHEITKALWCMLDVDGRQFTFTSKMPIVM